MGAAFVFKQPSNQQRPLSRPPVLFHLYGSRLGGNRKRLAETAATSQ